MYIDVTRTNTLTKSNQDSLATDDAVKLRRRAYNEMKKAKYGRYHAEAEYSGALLFPFCLDANGSFIPTDRSYNPGVHGRQAPLGKGLATQAGLRAVFEDGKAPQVRQLEISVEEGMIQKLSRGANQSAEGLSPMPPLEGVSCWMQRSPKMLLRVC